MEQREEPFAELPTTTERKFLEKQIVLVGYGRVGQRIAASLMEKDIPYVIAEQNREIVEGLRKAGTPAASRNSDRRSLSSSSDSVEAYQGECNQ